MTVMRIDNILKVLLLFVTISTADVSRASTLETEAQGEWQRALEAYSAKEYAVACEAFERVAELGCASEELYYNLANAYFKLGVGGEKPFSSGELGRAILNYRRALRLDPTMEDAQYNLDLAVDYTNDAEPLPRGVLSTMWSSLSGMMTSNGWAILSVILFALTLLLVLVYLLSQRIYLRKVAFFIAILSLVLFLFATIFSLSERSLFENSTMAVVICGDVASVHASPDNSSKVIRQPSQGVTVDVLREHGEWSEIEFVDGEKGWIMTTTIERI